MRNSPPIKVIIPMAGHSRRFQAAGHTIPKPFILIDGKPMIQRVCQMFAPDDEFIFICNQEQMAANPEYREVLDGVRPRTRIVEVPSHELGPVYSVLAADEFMEPNEPLIISYCDFTMRWNYFHFRLKAAMYEGAIPVFRGFHPASFGDTYYCYIRTNEELEMIELREKQSFTDNRAEEFASTGVYYLDRWDRYKKYSLEIIEKGQKVAAEYYASLIYPPMVRDGNKVCVFEVDNFICWGTPEDLAEYTFWSSYFTNSANVIQSPTN
jgi:NDP-sugar pyrophosphorylase family protein